MESTPTQTTQVNTTQSKGVQMLARLPLALVLLRSAIAPILLWDAFDHQVSQWFVPLYVVAVLSDIFDGMIARRLGLSTAGLRQADSWADRALYGCLAIAAWWVHPEIIVAFRWPLLAVCIAQGLWWLVNLVKYGQPASYHTYSAKLWGLTLLVATIALFGWGVGSWYLSVAIIAGVIHTVEEIAMTLLLPTWEHDILSIFAAWQRRQLLLGSGGSDEPRLSELKP